MKGFMMNYAVKPYLPLELRKVSRFLMFELIVLNLCAFILMLEWIVEYKTLELEGEWSIFFGFFLVPLCVYKWMSFLIEKLEYAQRIFLLFYKVHIVTHCLVMILPFMMDMESIKVLWSTYIFFACVVCFFFIGVMFYRNIIGLRFQWNRSDKLSFFKHWSLSFFIEKTFRKIHQFYIAFLIFLVHITVFFYWSGSHLTIDPDLMKLLPDDFPTVLKLREAEKILGALEYITIMIESNEVENEKQEFQNKLGIKILNEYRHKQEKVKTHRVMNSEGILTDKTKPIIDFMYYHNKNHSANTKHIWHAELIQTKAFVHNLAKRIEKLPHVMYCEYSFPSDFVRENALLFEDLETLALLYTRIKKKQRDLLFGKIGFDLELDTGNSDNDSYFSLLEKGNYVRNDGYYISGNNRTIVFFIKPNQGSLNIAFNETLLNEVRQIVSQEVGAFQNQYPNAPQINIGYLGRHQHKVELSEILKRDLHVIVYISFFCIMCVIVLYFKRYSTLFLLSVPIVMSLIWTFGITYWSFGRLNILTEFLAVILMGLGIDFAIYLLSRYYEERERGETHNSALYLMLRFTIKATFTALITTVVAFFVLSFSKFQGFREFGLLGVFGLVMSYLCMLYVLPILLIVTQKLSKLVQTYYKIYFPNNKGKRFFVYLIVCLCAGNLILIAKDLLDVSTTSVFHMPLYYFIFPYMCLLRLLLFLQGKYLKQITIFSTIKKIFQRPKSIVMGIGFLCIICTFCVSGVEFDYDFTKLTGQTNSFLLKDVLVDHFPTFSIPSIAIAQNNEEEREIYDLYKKHKEFFGVNSKINYVTGMSYYTPRHQEEKMELIQEFKKIINTFNKNTNMQSRQQTQQIKNLQNKLSNFHNKYLSNIDIIYPQLIPVEIQRLYKNINNPKDSRRLVYIFPYFQDLTDGKAMQLFAQEVRSLKLPNKWIPIQEYQIRSGLNEKDILGKIANNELNSKKENNQRSILLKDRKVNITGEDLIMADILFLIEYDFIVIVVGTCFLCMGILWLNFKDLKILLSILTYFFCAILLFFGLMFIFDVKFNIINVALLPLIFGITVDGGVHFYHRYLSEGKGSVFFVLRNTGAATFFACLTSILAFASLFYSHQHSIQSMGSLAILGIFSGLLMSCILLPALIMIQEK